MLAIGQRPLSSLRHMDISIGLCYGMAAGFLQSKKPMREKTHAEDFIISSLTWHPITLPCYIYYNWVDNSNPHSRVRNYTRVLMIGRWNHYAAFRSMSCCYNLLLNILSTSIEEKINERYNVLSLNYLLMYMLYYIIASFWQ